MANGDPFSSVHRDTDHLLTTMISPPQSTLENSDSLQVGQIMRSVDSVDTFDSIVQAATRLQSNGIDVLPVVNQGRFVGVITENSLAKALASKLDWTAPASDIMIDAPTVRADADQKEALQLLNSNAFSAITVVDRDGQVMGIVSASCFSPSQLTENRPMMVGGMATPFGVYLTNGAVGSGAKGFPLVLTGFTLFVLLIIAQLGSKMAENQVADRIPEALRHVAFGLLPMVLFFLLMRVIPLSGTHGAEHQVVHAIERGEPLVPEIVTRMPRVHPRCGTNIAVGASMFLAITQLPWIASQEVRLGVGLLATMFLWQPIGNFLQQYITTRKPTFKQLHTGIAAGKELIRNASTVRSTHPNIGVRIYHSGMLHVMMGSALCYGAGRILQTVFQIDLGLE